MEEDKDSISFPYKDWEQIYPLPFESSSPSSFPLSSSIQTHNFPSTDVQEEPPSTGWEVVLRRETQSADDYSIFPPSNHEGLHIPFQEDHLQGRQEQLVSEEEPESEVEASTSPMPSPSPSPSPSPTPTPTPSPSDSVLEFPTPRLSDSSLRVAGDIVKQLRFGLEFLCSNFFRIASSLRSRIIIRGNFWPVSSSIGVAAALLSSLLYMGVRRWRRRIQLGKLDRLILLIQEQDQKISRLSQQIAQMNEVLSAHYRVPVLRKG
ncbi:uncharacterized protein LOC122075931 [Macadamia integrifolia]|uniref:uncharacterized protein LOC122075931 n=1 Tax=Macadamia integrifolia TaxID=60698 RepID=UPI001C4E3F6F|nr:uncharacterized protein LOC122075931 [Macadamia integrifolia]